MILLHVPTLVDENQIVYADGVHNDSEAVNNWNKGIKRAYFVSGVPFELAKQTFLVKLYLADMSDTEIALIQKAIIALELDWIVSNKPFLI